MRRGLRGLLKEAFPDLVIGEALDARQTLAAVEKKAWDLVLLDINMPGRSGLDVLQDLKRLYPKLPVVILSAFPGEGLRGAGLQAGGLRLRFETERLG